MQFSRVALYPVSAIGTVTLNNVEVANGSVTSAFGQLVVEGGDYDIEGISVRNNGITWIPTSSSASSKTYNVQSNGLFEVLAGGVVVFSWHNQMSQDFTINAMYYINAEDHNKPGPKAADKTYLQMSTQSKSEKVVVWVESTGTDISELDLSATNNASVSVQPKDPELSNGYLRILVDMTDSAVGLPLEVRVGDVLVIYYAKITA